MADTSDLKSDGGYLVPVQVRSRLPKGNTMFFIVFILVLFDVFLYSKYKPHEPKSIIDWILFMLPGSGFYFFFKN